MSLLDQASLVLVPSAYRTGEVLVQKPLPTKFSDETGNYDGNDPQGSANLTFTRNSNASRVTADGKVERVRTNLILQSNQFNTTWTPNNATLTSGQAGYDGTNDAHKLVSNTANAGHRVFQAQVQTGVLTFSIYAKAGGYDFMFIYINGKSAYFDLANGSVGTESGLIDSSIAVAGNDFYRCSITFSGVTTSNVEVYIANTGSTYVFAGDGTSGIFIQDAQFETGDIATDYIPTTTSARSTFAGITVDGTSVPNVPRLDYSGGASCPSLLLEPQRTNQYPYSEQLNQWTATQSAIVTANYATSPDGYINADRVQFTAGALVYMSGTGSAGENTLSVYAKATNGTSAIFRFFANGATTFSSDQTATGEWQRFTFTYTYSAVTAGLARPTTNVDDVIFWGFQHEIGSYASSYIGPTLGASVTRLADAAYKTGISSLIGQTEGTVFADFVYDGLGTEQRLGISDGTSANYNNLRITTGGTLYVLGGASSVLQYEINCGSLSIGTRYKVALAYKQNDIVAYLNGSNVGSDNSATIGACSRFGFDNRDATSVPFRSPVNQAILFKTRLPNATLANLTAL